MMIAQQVVRRPYLLAFAGLAALMNPVLEPQWAGAADPYKVVEDDLQSDTRSQYEIEGDIQWSAGSLEVLEKAHIQKTEIIGPTCKLNLKLALPPLVEEQTWEARLTFSYQETMDRLEVHLIREQQNGKERASIRFFSHGKSEHAASDRPLREYKFDRDLSSGDWLFHHHLGLLTVAVDGKEFAAGYHESEDAPVISWKLTMLRGRVAIGTISCLQTTAAKYTEEQMQELGRADALDNDIAVFVARGQFQKATKSLGQSLEIRRRIQGQAHYASLQAAANLALAYTNGGYLNEAGKIYEASLPVLEKELGSSHPEFATVLNNVGFLRAESGQDQEAEKCYLKSLAIRRSRLGENHLHVVISLSNLAEHYRKTGQYGEAKQCFDKVIKAGKLAFGEDHPNYAILLNNLAIFYADVGDYTNAESTWKNVLAIRSRVLPPGHPYLAMTYASIAEFYRTIGEFTKASELFQKAVPLVKAAFGEHHYGYSVVLNNQALLYHEMGQLAKSFELNIRVLDLRKKYLQPEHPVIPGTILSLAMLHADMGDLASAVATCQQSLQLAKKSLGPEHPNTLTITSNLALLYHRIGRVSESLKLNEEVRTIRKRVLGETHPLYGLTLHNLAELYRSVGESEKAEALFAEALPIVKASQGANHPGYFSCLNNFALLREQQGKFDESIKIIQEVVDGRRKALGKDHPHYALSVVNLARMHRQRNNSKQARLLLREALKIDRKLLDETSLIQSERQQLAMGEQLRYHLDEYISLEMSSDGKAQDIFARVLDWKGATLVRQRQVRTIGDEAELTSLFQELQRVTRRLAALAWFQSDPGRKMAWREEIAVLTAKKEGLEARLMKESTAFRNLKKRISVQDVVAALADDSVLVDFLEYSHSTPDQERKGQWSSARRLAAFVVRPGRPITAVDLGDVDAISSAFDRWRHTFGMSTVSARAGLELRRAVWNPLEIHLQGAATILVSPDGVLGRLPLAALPGKKPGEYLIEEYRIAYIPVPQLLPALVNQLGKQRLRKGLLLIGDVDYGSSPKDGEEFARAAHRSHFYPLPGTAKELETIEQSFLKNSPKGKIVALRGKDATEQSFRTLVTDCTTAHIATHAFFEEPSSASAKFTSSTYRSAQLMDSGDFSEPVGSQLVAGMVFAGANEVGTLDLDDGILTVNEISALQLDEVDLITLSACETGLGRIAAGEGLVGIQRTFQVSGVQATISSLWKVDDVATQRLMSRFYENYWTKGLSKLDALHEAQVWVLRSPTAIQGTDRGSIVKRKVQRADDTVKANGNSPEFWAAFILSGGTPARSDPSDN